MFSASPLLLGPTSKSSRSKGELEPAEQGADPAPAPGTHSLAHMLGLQTPQTGGNAKEEEISCCSKLVVNEFLVLYMALAYGEFVWVDGVGIGSGHVSLSSSHVPAIPLFQLTGSTCRVSTFKCCYPSTFPDRSFPSHPMKPQPPSLAPSMC